MAATTTTTTRIRRDKNDNHYCFSMLLGNGMARTLLLFMVMIPSVLSALSCTSDEFCRDIIHPNAKCINAYCSNPFQQGCLRTMLGEDYNKRICASDDINPDNCITSFWNYTEWRIHHANWESSIFYAWILQILFMEILQVPVTIGSVTGDTLRNSFYSPNNTFEFSPLTYPWEAFETSYNVGDCTKTTEPCVHVLPDVWNGQFPEISKAVSKGFLDPPVGNGQVGTLGWQVPAFTAARDKTLLSFYGLQGERNRHKLAKTFLRPITYGTYCDTVSVTNCSEVDNIAPRYPQDESEHTSYFVLDAFPGHFVFTEKNNCTKFPKTCTGHFVAPPCEWSMNIDAQMYWNDFVGLESDGPLPPNGHYQYSHLVQIWRAANATRQDLITWFWKPEPTVVEFFGTEAEFQDVLLPQPSGQCVLSRPDIATRCSDDIWVRRHEAVSACDQEPHAVVRAVSSLIADEFYSQSKAMQSPAHGLLRNLQITDLQVNLFVEDWTFQKVDKYGQDARQIVCNFVVENLETLIKQAIPYGYPRKIEYLNASTYLIGQAAKALSIVMVILVILAAVAVYRYRKMRVFVFAQVYFIHLILLGSLCICFGAMTAALEPTNFTCTVTEWLVSLGYTGQLVPLLVKISTLQTLFKDAQKMKRSQVTSESMFQKVILVMLIVIIYLVIWTIVDPPQHSQTLILIDNPREQQDIVKVQDACESKYNVWLYVANGWESIWLLGAAVLAFQSRGIRQEFNESASLATLVYTHVIFLLLRLTFELLQYQQVVTASTASASRSFFLSLDTLLGMGVYLFPKFMVILHPTGGSPLDLAAASHMRASMISSLKGKSDISSDFPSHRSGGYVTTSSLSSNKCNKGVSFVLSESIPEPMSDGDISSSQHDLESSIEDTTVSPNNNEFTATTITMTSETEKSFNDWNSPDDDDDNDDDDNNNDDGSTRSIESHMD